MWPKSDQDLTPDQMLDPPEEHFDLYDYLEHEADRLNDEAKEREADEKDRLQNP